MSDCYLQDQHFQAALPILETIEDHGYEAYFVGGSVRDTLLGLKIHDIDIASNALPQEIQTIFPRTIDLGMEHGTVIVLQEEAAYEITTFRTEGTYTDGRRPDEVSFIRDLKEDTLRRDFTINALAFDRHGKLYDYHCGRKDLNMKIIRAVGIPRERFGEDSLRMIRAIRFATQLGFGIEAETLQAIQQLKQNIQQVSVERIREELTKTLAGDYFVQQGHLLNNSGLLTYLPKLAVFDTQSAVDFLKIALRNNEKATYDRSESFLWAFFLLGLEIQAQAKQKQFLRTWKHSNHTIREVTEYIQIINCFNDNQLTAWDLYQFDDALVKNVQNWAQQQGLTISFDVQAMHQQLPIQHRDELQLDGRQVMELLAMTRGSALVGEIIYAAEKAVVQGTLANTRQALDHFVLHYE